MAEPQAASPDRLRVLTLNVYPGMPLPIALFTDALQRSSRLGKIADMIKRERPDVVCLQEMYSYDAIDKLRAALPDYRTLKYDHDNRCPKLALYAGCFVLYLVFRILLDVLFDRDPSPACHIITMSIFWTWLWTESPVYAWMFGNEAGLFTLYRRELDQGTVIRSYHYRFSEEDCDAVSGGTHRGFRLLRIAFRDHVWMIINTHLNAYGDDKLRLQQMRTLGQVANGNTDIICGDLNCPPSSSVHTWLHSSHFIDACRNQNKNTWYPLWWMVGEQPRRLDYVYADARACVGRVLDDVVSDHRAVVAYVYCTKDPAPPPVQQQAPAAA